MNARVKRKAFLHERGIAWILTFLLTGFMVAALLSAFAVQVLTSAALHLQVATDGGVVDSQLRHIHENVDMLAEEYGFSAEAVKEVIDRDELVRVNTEIAAWWTTLLTEGDTGTIPRWYSAKLEEAVNSSMRAETAKIDPQTVVADLTEMVERTVFPLRETLLSTGMELVNGRADVPGLIRSVTKFPMLGLVMSLAVAGGIALVLGREILRCLKYYGTAAAGAGLTLLSAGIIVLVMRPKAMVAQASEPLAGEMGSLLGKIGWQAGLAVVILLAVGYGCLILYRRNQSNRETDGEVSE